MNQTRVVSKRLAYDAIQWDGDLHTLERIHNMVGANANPTLTDDQLLLLQIDTEVGQEYAYPLDWVLWNGEYSHVVKRERFKAEYTPEYTIGDTITTPVTITVEHPLKTQAEKVAFREAWDARVERGKR